MSSNTSDIHYSELGETTKATDVRQMSTAEIVAAIRRIHQQQREEMRKKQEEIERRERELAQARQTLVQAEALPRSKQQTIQPAGGPRKQHAATNRAVETGGRPSTRQQGISEAISVGGSCAKDGVDEAAGRARVRHHCHVRDAVPSGRRVSTKTSAGHPEPHVPNSSREGPELAVTSGVLTRSVGSINY